MPSSRNVCESGKGQNPASSNRAANSCADRSQGAHDQLSRRRAFSDRATITAARHESLQILVTPTHGGRKWRASHDGAALCLSASPLITSARILVARGLDPTRVIEMWHVNKDAWSLRGHLGEVAATLVDGETVSRIAKNRVPVRLSDKDATRCRRSRRARPGNIQVRPSASSDIAFDIPVTDDAQV